MPVKIGHASIDERGTARGGAAGDQTGKEVCTRSWYSKPWAYVLRPVTQSLALRMAKACEAGCANPRIGYDQNQRNTAHTAAQEAGYDLSKISRLCETDCSAFMTLCAIAAGVTELEYTGNAPTTSTMLERFMATGKFEAFSSAEKRLTSDAYLMRGDILVKPGAHTVMVLSNGAAIGSTPCPYLCSYRTLKQGRVGEDVRWLQWQLNYRGYITAVDGEFGPNTEASVRKFQKVFGLEVDGVVGSQTYGVIK